MKSYNDWTALFGFIFITFIFCTKFNNYDFYYYFYGNLRFLNFIITLVVYIVFLPTLNKEQKNFNRRVVQREYTGSAYGILSTLMNFVSTIGPIIVGIILDIHDENVNLGILNSYNWVFF